MPKGIPNKRYTPELKKAAVEAVFEDGLSYYLAEGAEGLAVYRRSRARAASGGKKGYPAKLPKEVEEDLLGEVQRL